MILLGIALVALAFYFYSPRTPLSRQPESASAVDEVSRIKSIAVLPFRPIGEEVDKEKLGLGMSDAVIARLSNLRLIAVRPTSSVFRFAESAPVNAVQAGREMGVDSILEGTVQRDGEKVRVSVQLVRVRDGKTLWADSFQEQFSDIFSLQDSISSKVATTLSLNLGERQQQILARHPTSSAEAFQAYQMGIYFWNKRKKDDLQKAVEYFQRAVEIDPSYAQAHASLADTYSMMAYYRYHDDFEQMKTKTRAAAERALSLDDSLAEAYIALGISYAIKNENFAKTQELFERAVELAPYSSIARHRYAWILLMNGKLSEGVLEMRAARENDPLSPATNLPIAACSSCSTTSRKPCANASRDSKSIRGRPTAGALWLALIFTPEDRRRRSSSWKLS
jgi:TolB-like protein